MKDGAVSIVRLWDVLLLPLQGEVTDEQAERLCDEVLRQVQQRGPRGLVIDLSGVALLDSHLCSSIAHLNSIGRGTAMFGASFAVRTVATLLMNVMNMASGASDNPNKFFDNEAQARAWLQERIKIAGG